MTIQLDDWSRAVGTSSTYFYSESKVEIEVGDSTIKLIRALEAYIYRKKLDLLWCDIKCPPTLVESDVRERRGAESLRADIVLKYSGLKTQTCWLLFPQIVQELRRQQVFYPFVSCRWCVQIKCFHRIITIGYNVYHLWPALVQNPQLVSSLAHRSL